MPSPITRAMQTLSDAGDVRRAAEMPRVGSTRDRSREVRANELYEELRCLDRARLLERADQIGVPLVARLSRQALIASLIEAMEES